MRCKRRGGQRRGGRIAVDVIVVAVRIDDVSDRQLLRIGASHEDLW
jgi:hypothetical protein